MKRNTLGGIALLLLAPSWAWAQASFTRPECAADAALTPQAAEARCMVRTSCPLRPGALLPTPAIWPS